MVAHGVIALVSFRTDRITIPERWSAESVYFLPYPDKPFCDFCRGQLHLVVSEVYARTAAGRQNRHTDISSTYFMHILWYRDPESEVTTHKPISNPTLLIRFFRLNTSRSSLETIAYSTNE